MRIRFGIAGRLFAAFAGVAALSIVAGIIGWVVVGNVDTAQKTIVDQAMPVVVEGRIIAETSGQIVAHGPRLGRATTEAVRNSEAEFIRSKTDQLSASLSALAEYGFPRLEVAELRGVVSELAANLNRQDKIVEARIELAADLLVAIGQSLNAARELSSLSETLTSNAASGATVVISNLYELAEDPDRLPETFDALDRLVEVDLFLLERMFELRMRASALGLLLHQLNRASEPDDISWIRERYSDNLRILVRRVALIDDPIRREQAESILAELSTDTSLGNTKLFDVRSRMLQLDQDLILLADSNRALTNLMNERVAAVVTHSQKIAKDASEAAENAVEFGSLMLLLQIALFVGIAGAIAWLYVHRNVVRRLTVLHQAMQGLAAGHLNVAVPTGGNDELSEMADTVRVFRDQAIVKQRLEAERDRTEAELRRHKEELEQLVSERTEQLTETNARLVDEVRNHDIARTDAEKANRAKSEFLATMSHEIRTPMNGVLGMVRLVADGPLNRRQQKQLRVIRSSGEILLGILNDILDYSKIESGEIAAQHVDFDLHELAEDVAALMQGRAREKGLTLTLRISEDVPAVVVGDRQKLSQVLLNLLGNGIKFTDRGTISLTILKIEEPDELALSVEDTGPGIAERDLEHLFEPFYQVTEHRRRGQIAGTGLGLAISKRLVVAMGGHIGVEAKEGEGSRFWVTLPLPEGDAAALRPKAINLPDDMPSVASLRILIVEDNVINAMVIKAFISNMGHKPHMATTGEQGLQLLDNMAFDLILMDISLPGIDGVETAARVRAHTNPLVRTLPIIAMSAHVFENEITEHLEAGMDAFIGKPISPDFLAETIAWVMGGPEVAFDRNDNGGAGADELIVDRNILLQDRAALGSKRGALMIKTFGDTAPIQIGDIKSALADGRADVVAETAHALKGAASSLGLPRLAHHCGLLEARAQSPEAAQLAEKLGHMYDDSWTALENLWIELETAERDDQVVTEGAKT